MFICKSDPLLHVAIGGDRLSSSFAEKTCSVAGCSLWQEGCQGELYLEVLVVSALAVPSVVVCGMWWGGDQAKRI